MASHAEELEKSYMQLMGYTMDLTKDFNQRTRFNSCLEDPLNVDKTALQAAIALAQQRLEWYQDDCKTATTLVKSAKPKAAAGEAGKESRTWFIIFYIVPSVRGWRWACKAPPRQADWVSDPFLGFCL